MTISWALGGAVWLAAVGALSAGEVRLESPAGRRVSLVELYTSEGCSSCPPAEAWLSGLTSSTRLWKDFVPVAFHVDYWDNLGWRDRYASAVWTARQRAYAARWGSSTVYTPGFVRDGQEWRRAGNAPEASGAAKDAGALTAVVTDGRKVAVTYRPTADAKAERKVCVARLGFGLDSDVRAGENQGRKLRHDFVALGLETKALSEGTVGFELPAPAAGIAVWVEKDGAVEQAAGGFLK